MCDKKKFDENTYDKVLGYGIYCALYVDFVIIRVSDIVGVHKPPMHYMQMYRCSIAHADCMHEFSLYRIFYCAFQDIMVHSIRAAIIIIPMHMCISTVLIFKFGWNHYHSC